MAGRRVRTTSRLKTEKRSLMKIGKVNDSGAELEIRVRPDSGDNTLGLREALNLISSERPCRLVLEKGEYDFYDQYCFEFFCFVSNNSPGLKRIAFPLVGSKNLTIDGQGSLLRFHGRICPFLVRECENVTIRDLTIDYPRPFISQATIETVTPEGVYIRMERGYPYCFEGGRIWFNGDYYDQRGVDTGKLFKRDSFLHCLEYDTVRQETAFMACDHFMIPASAVSEIEKGLLHVANSFPGPPLKIGNTLMVSHDHRDCFGILIDESSNIEIEQVTLNHTGAMAMIAQRSDTLTLRECVVAPDKSSGRLVSSFADASHFANCRGLIRIHGCRFENMLDDPVNIHGIYSPVRRIIDSHSLEIGNGHFEQAGIQVVDPGATIRLISRQTLLPLGECGVRSVEMINSYLWRVELDRPLSAGVEVGDCVESMHWVPNVEIRDCRFGKNRARGPLISSGGDVIVENNHFHHAGSAIKISGDTHDWFESGAVRNILIHGNTFENCGYGRWGKGIIAIDPEIHPEAFRKEAYHRNIQIIGNEFQTFHNELVFARCVDGLKIRDNTVIETDDYPNKEVSFTGLATENCSNVESQF